MNTTKRAGKKGGGGRNPEIGMSFQARVGVWFAVHMILRESVGELFGLSDQSYPIALKFETGKGMDDLTVTQNDGSEIHVQCKTNLSVSKSPDSPFGKTVRQVVQLFLSGRQKNSGNKRAANSKAVLVVSQKAPRSLDSLNEVLCDFKVGLSWEEIKSSGRNEEELRLLGILESHLRNTWAEESGEKSSAHNLTEVAQMFRIVRLDLNNTNNMGKEWLRARKLIGLLYDNDDGQLGKRVLEKLLNLIREHTGRGTPVKREGLISALREAGFEDKYYPKFDRDIKQLKDESKRLVKSHILRHSCLLPDGGISIARECMGDLEKSTEEDGLLIIGDPGSGKTGILSSIAGKKSR